MRNPCNKSTLTRLGPDLYPDEVLVSKPDKFLIGKLRDAEIRSSLDEHY